MKEFSVTLKEGILRGLRTSDTNPRNTEALTECHNLKPGAGDLESYEAITDISGALSVSWPYPQVFLGSNYRLICTNTTVYEMDSSWTQTSKVVTTADDIWDLADFGTYCLLANGTKLVEIDADGAYSANDSLTNTPRFLTGCNFKGQLVAGNIKTTWHGCGTNSVIWSAIGSIDCTPNASNIAGFREMPWNGTVKRVLPLDTGVVVYGDNGIAALIPRGTTFGLKPLLGTGIPFKGAVAGDDKEHLFVDQEGTFWKITADFQLKELGYKEFGSLIDLTEIMVSYDTGKKEYFICDDSYSYLLTRYGLGQMYQRVTSVCNVDGVTYGVSDDDSDLEGRIITDTLDFGVRGIKTVMTVEAGINHASGSDMHFRAGYRYNKTSAITNLGWRLASPEGFATLVAGGTEFRIGLKVDSYLTTNVDSLIVRVKLTDRRTLKGPPAQWIGAITG